MEHLWAPWRKAYVKSSGESIGNLFERIGRSNEDEQNYVLLRAKSCYALLNRYPYNTAHTLVVPYREVGDLEALSEDENHEIFSVVLRIKAAIMRLLKPHGFNIGINLGEAAGAGIAQHLHWHVVPRWHHDVNFMTALAETRIHPSDLNEVYRLLRAEVEAGN